ncbi:MAG: acyl-CoA thioesterase/bile acid-CoA:amino acid N-acyltransferase family protein [Bryobacteraceae bacterium]
MLRNLALVVYLAWVALHAQTIEAVPRRVMVDQSASIRAAGLQPNEHITIRAELVDGNEARWTSHADFVADEQGRIDTSKQPATGGSYKEVSAMGLVWSMMPSSSRTVRYRSPEDFGPQTIEFQLMRGHAQLSTAQLEQVSQAAGVERVTEMHGVLFVPPGGGRHPGVLVLGGSEGGLPSRRAAWLAGHGFAALALAYFRYADLPQELAGIPLEYFGKAVNWMTQRPEIAPDRIAVMGTSRGGELALQLGSMYPTFKAVVAYSPADVRYPACCGLTSVPYAWTWHGNPLAYALLRRGGERDPETALQGAIEVERTQGPILLLSGNADGIWESTGMANAIVARLERHHFTYQVEHLSYPHAGHQAGHPEIVPAWVGESRNPMSGRDRHPGGSPKGNFESSLDAGPRVIAFLQRSLSATRSSP